MLYILNLEMIKTRSYGMYYKSIGDFDLALDYFSKLEKLADNEGASYVSLFFYQRKNINL